MRGAYRQTSVIYWTDVKGDANFEIILPFRANSGKFSLFFPAGTYSPTGRFGRYPHLTLFPVVLQARVAPSPGLSDLRGHGRGLDQPADLTLTLTFSPVGAGVSLLLLVDQVRPGVAERVCGVEGRGFRRRGGVAKLGKVVD